MVEHINDDEDGRYTDRGSWNHPAINSKPLTVLPLHSRPIRSSIATSAASAKIATTIPRTPVVNLQFINTAYPGESTTAKRISQIRSHVAKDSHARRRQRKAAQARSSTTSSSSKGKKNIIPYSSASSSLPYVLAADDAAQTDESYSTSASPDGLQHPHQAWHSSTNTGLGHKGFRRIAPKEGAMVRKVASPGPRQMIGDTMKDAWNGQFAWELSVEDYDIFNYCKSICLTPFFVKVHVTSLGTTTRTSCFISPSHVMRILSIMLSCRVPVECTLAAMTCIIRRLYAQAGGSYTF